MSDNKTHYRKVFKSDHLGIADLEDLIESGSNLVFTIRCVKQEYGTTVAGKKGDHNIAYFHDKIKPLVLNATNSKIVKMFAKGSPFVEDWNDIPVQLYIDPNVKMKGEIVGGVRIIPTAPRITKPELTPESNNWQGAVTAYKRDGNLKKVLERVTISTENQKLIIEEAGNDTPPDSAE